MTSGVWKIQYFEQMTWDLWVCGDLLGQECVVTKHQHWKSPSVALQG